MQRKQRKHWKILSLTRYNTKTKTSLETLSKSKNVKMPRQPLILCLHSPILLYIAIFLYRRLLKIRHRYLKIIKIDTSITYLKKMQKIIKYIWHAPECCWHQDFSPEISNLCFIKKCRYRLYFNIEFLIRLTCLTI